MKQKLCVAWFSANDSQITMCVAWFSANDSQITMVHMAPTSHPTLPHVAACFVTMAHCVTKARKMSDLIHCLHILSLWHILSLHGDKTCRKVHLLHDLSPLHQQHYNLSFPSLNVCVCMCVRACVFVPVCLCVCVCVCWCAFVCGSACACRCVVVYCVVVYYPRPSQRSTEIL